MGKGLELFEAYQNSELAFLKYVFEDTEIDHTKVNMMVYDQTDDYWSVGKMMNEVNWAQLPEDVSGKKGNYYAQDINHQGGGVMRKDDITVVCCYSGNTHSTYSELLVFKNELEVDVETKARYDFLTKK